MASENATGIVLRCVDFSETSKIVTLFTLELGKLGALAKGARRLKSSFEVALDVLSVCRIGVLRKPRAELDLLTEALLIERFDGLRHNLDALYASYYVAEILDSLTQPHDPHPLLFDATVETIRRLSAGDDRLLQLVRYQWTLFTELGYGPNLAECGSCGDQVPAKRNVSFSVSAGGVVCENCSPRLRDVRVLEGGSLQALRLLSSLVAQGSAAEGRSGPHYAGLEQAWQRLKLRDRNRSELWETATSCIVYLMGKRPRTLSLLRW